MRMVSPALPLGMTLIQPAIFCPKSMICVPLPWGVTDNADATSSALMPGVICGVSTPVGISVRSAFAQLLSSYPGSVQPPNSIRASYSSPSYSLLARTGPLAVMRQFSSVTNRCCLPSVYSMMIFRRHFGNPNTGVLYGLFWRMGK